MGREGKTNIDVFLRNEMTSPKKTRVVNECPAPSIERLLQMTASLQRLTFKLALGSLLRKYWHFNYDIFWQWTL